MKSPLQEAATLRPAAAAVLKEVRKIANVYVIAHVGDDLGEATVRGALEAGESYGAQAAHSITVLTACCLPQLHIAPQEPIC